MAIDRAPWTALIDDDGTNTKGTVWNKDKIKTVILDPVEAAFGVWANVPFNAADFSGIAPLTWTVGAAAVIRNRYALVGKILFWSIYVSWFSGANVLSGTVGPKLRLKIPGGFAGSAGNQIQVLSFSAGIAGVPQLNGLYATDNGTFLEIQKGGGGNFALSDIPGFITTLMIEIT